MKWGIFFIIIDTIIFIFTYFRNEWLKIHEENVIETKPKSRQIIRHPFPDSFHPSPKSPLKSQGLYLLQEKLTKKKNEDCRVHFFAAILEVLNLHTISFKMSRTCLCYDPGR